MIPTEIISKIKKLEIKTRHIVETTFSGEYHSVFKGRGISFSEVREYQHGDDTRLIDWNVTARMGTPFIKLFEEERELTVMLLIDISASNNFGSHSKTKSEIAAEIAAILGFSAINNNDRVGLILFTDKIEKYIPPKKGKNHIFRILSDIFHNNPENKKTSIAEALDYLNKTTKKKAIVFLISDFIDQHFEKSCKITAKKHDLVPIILHDPHEETLPKAGLLALENQETEEVIYINSNSKDIRHRFSNIIYAKQRNLSNYFKTLNISTININIDMPYFENLIKYFKYRSKKH